MEYFIGIDVHKDTSHIVALDERGIPVLDKNVRTTRERLDDVLAPLAPAKVLIEASGRSRWVAEHLEGQGHTVFVGDPNYALMYASRPANCKNDRNDARALAFACQAGHFKSVHRPSAEHRALQELLGSRASLVANRTMHINRLRALFAARGIELPRGEKATLWYRVKAQGIPAELDQAVRPLLEMLAMLEDQLRWCDARVEELANQDEVARRLQTVPGVGALLALLYVATIGTPSRFVSAHQVESYLGLVPKIHASAKPGVGRHISKHGSTYLRALLVQAAWSFMRSNDPRATPTQEWTNALAQRRPTQVAIIALTRRLAGVLYAMWRDGTDFERREQKAGLSAMGATPKPIVRKYRLKTSSKTPVSA
jgi:transposase